MRAVYSGNSSYSTGVAGPITLTVKAGTSTGTGAGSASVNVQGLWWGTASESGWGVNLTQQGNLLFATWFTYDAQGKGQWFVMSAGALSGTNTWTGTLYRTRGPSYTNGSFDPSQGFATMRRSRIAAHGAGVERAHQRGPTGFEEIEAVATVRPDAENRDQ
jgi:hypothetical protein